MERAIHPSRLLRAAALCRVRRCPPGGRALDLGFWVGGRRVWNDVVSAVGDKGVKPTRCISPRGMEQWWSLRRPDGRVGPGGDDFKQVSTTRSPREDQRGPVSTWALGPGTTRTAACMDHSTTRSLVPSLLGLYPTSPLKTLLGLY